MLEHATINSSPCMNNIQSIYESILLKVSAFKPMGRSVKLVLQGAELSDGSIRLSFVKTNGFSPVRVFLHYFLALLQQFMNGSRYLGGTGKDFETKEKDSIVFNGLLPWPMLCIFHHTHTHTHVLSSFTPAWQVSNVADNDAHSHRSLLMFHQYCS